MIEALQIIGMIGLGFTAIATFVGTGLYTLMYFAKKGKLGSFGTDLLS